MIKHKGTQTLETQRLILRRFTLDDASAIFDNWASDDVVTRYLRKNTHQSIEETQEALKSWIDDYDNDQEYHWAIVTKDTNEPIGSFFLGKPMETAKLFYRDVDHTCYEIGYCLSQKFWGKGLASEVLTMVLAYGFDEVGLQKIVACHHGDNTASGKVLLKNGFTFDGELVVPFCKDPSAKVNTCFYSITKA